MYSVYVHVPFCSTVCAYCDFAVLPGSSRLHLLYLELLARELDIRCKRDAREPQTLYLGGGTPSELGRENFKHLFALLRTQGVLHKNLQEFTIECNPETTTADRLEVFHQAGVGRVSLGIQSFDANLLQRIGRKAYPAEARQALQMLLAQGFKVSGDLMFSLPGQTSAGFLEDLRELVSTGVEHVSFYGLSVEKRTLLGQWVRKGMVDANDDCYGEFYRLGSAYLESQGILRYEVSNFARPGFEGVHNRNYWRRGEYLGLGPGAHSFCGYLRSGSPRTFLRWKAWVEAGCPETGMELDPLGPEQERVEWIWLGLRQAEGLDLQAFADAVGAHLEPSAWQAFVQKGWMVHSGRFLQVVGEGWNFIDAIVAELVAKLDSR